MWPRCKCGPDVRDVGGGRGNARWPFRGVLPPLSQSGPFPWLSLQEAGGSAFSYKHFGCVGETAHYPALFFFFLKFSNSC